MFPADMNSIVKMFSSFRLSDYFPQGGGDDFSQVTEFPTIDTE